MGTYDGSLLMVYRIGDPMAYRVTRSFDEGETWTPSKVIGPAHAVDPSLIMVNGPHGKPYVVLAGGRPGLFIHASADGGETWVTYNLMAQHNALIAAHGDPSVNNTFPEDCVDTRQGGTVTTSGYLSLVPINHSR